MIQIERTGVRWSQKAMFKLRNSTASIFTTARERLVLRIEKSSGRRCRVGHRSIARKHLRRALPPREDDVDPTSKSASNERSSSMESDNDIEEDRELEKEGEKKSPSGRFFAVLQHAFFWFGAPARLLVAQFSILVTFLRKRLPFLTFVTIQTWASIFVAGVVLASFSASMTSGKANASKVSKEVLYSEFLRQVKQGNVQSVRIMESTNRIYFKLNKQEDVDSKDAILDTERGMDERKSSQGPAAAPSLSTAHGAGKSISRPYYTKYVRDASLIPLLTEAGIEFGAAQQSVSSMLTRALLTAFALWIPLLPFFFYLRRMTGGGSRKKKKASNSGNSGSPSITFKDVAGVDEAKAELQEAVLMLRGSERYNRMGAKLPAGILLCGPPGTGKTLLAKAVAGEAGVPFFSASASEFVELFVGRGAARIRELFAEARKVSPAVVFIDELDAVGSRRGMGLNEERDQTLNQLLTEMDGFDGSPGVLVLAATNRPEVLDQALMRPGRISRKITVGRPSEVGRKAILQVHLSKIPLEQSGADIATAIASVTPGMVGADLANIVNEAAMLAARKGKDTVGMEELLLAVQRERFGIAGGVPGFRQLAANLFGGLFNPSDSKGFQQSQGLGG